LNRPKAFSVCGTGDWAVAPSATRYALLARSQAPEMVTAAMITNAAMYRGMTKTVRGTRDLFQKNSIASENKPFDSLNTVIGNAGYNSYGSFPST